MKCPAQTHLSTSRRSCGSSNSYSVVSIRLMIPRMRRAVVGDLLKEAMVVLLLLSRVVTEADTHHKAVMAVLLLSKVATVNKDLVVMANSRVDTDDLLLSKVAIHNNRVVMVHLRRLLDIRLAILSNHDI